MSTARMYFIDQQIHNKKYPNCSTLARAYEVSSKTIQRDIDYMRSLDAPIAFDNLKKGYYYTDETYFLPAIPLSEREVLLIMINQRILSQYKETPYYDELKKIIDKILKFLPDELDTENMGDFISFQSQPNTIVEKQKFELLQQAICEERQINIQYYSQHRNEITKRRMDPYSIRYQHGA